MLEASLGGREKPEEGWGPPPSLGGSKMVSEPSHLLVSPFLGSMCSRLRVRFDVLEELKGVSWSRGPCHLPAATPALSKCLSFFLSLSLLP